MPTETHGLFISTDHLFGRKYQTTLGRSCFRIFKTKSSTRDFVTSDYFNASPQIYEVVLHFLDSHTIHQIKPNVGDLTFKK